VALNIKGSTKIDINPKNSIKRNVKSTDANVASVSSIPSPSALQLGHL